MLELLKVSSRTHRDTSSVVLLGYFAAGLTFTYIYMRIKLVQDELAIWATVKTMYSKFYAYYRARYKIAVHAIYSPQQLQIE